MQMLSENWIVAVIALVVAILVAWWLLAANRRTAITRETSDKDTSDKPARRNQALIDAAPAASVPPTTPEGLAGVGAALAAAADSAAQGDDLRRIKGVGPKVETLLHAMGIRTFSEIAAWSDEDVERVDARLGAFSGRIRRDDWRGQARLLSEGDTSAYEAVFGKL